MKTRFSLGLLAFAAAKTLLFASFAYGSPGNSAAAEGARETVLYSFQHNGTDGTNPFGGLTQGADGSFYGTTNLGGTYGDGTAFRVSIDPATGAVSETVLYAFNPSELVGVFPSPDLIQGKDGSFYGTTGTGGKY